MLEYRVSYKLSFRENRVVVKCLFNHNFSLSSSDSSSLNNARLQGTYIFHPICWHLLKLRQNKMKNERTESNSKQCSWSTGNDEKPKTEHCRMSHPIPILHALLLSQPCLLLQVLLNLECSGQMPTRKISCRVA